MGKLFTMLCAILLAGISCSFAGQETLRKDETKPRENTYNMDTLRTEINQFLDDWNHAMVVADTERLGAMMDDSIVLRHMSGMTQTKAEWLNEVASGSMNYHKIVKRDVKVSFADGVAAVAFTSVITANIWGMNGTWTLSGTMRLMKRDGLWIRVE